MVSDILIFAVILWLFQKKKQYQIAFTQPVTGFQLQSKFQESIKNLKISADSMFSF